MAQSSAVPEQAIWLPCTFRNDTLVIALVVRCEELELEERTGDHPSDAIELQTLAKGHLTCSFNRYANLSAVSSTKLLMLVDTTMTLGACLVLPKFGCANAAVGTS